MHQSREFEKIELDEKTIAAINEAEAQGDRGEGIEIDDVRRQMKERAEGGGQTLRSRNSM